MVVGVMGVRVVVAGMVSMVRMEAGGVTGAVGAEAAGKLMVTARVILACQAGRVAAVRGGCRVILRTGV